MFEMIPIIWSFNRRFVFSYGTPPMTHLTMAGLNFISDKSKCLSHKQKTSETHDKTLKCRVVMD